MPSGDVSAPAEDPLVANTPQLPWNQIPRFIPGTTNVQEYSAKMKFLASMWPSTHLDQLAPRAALMVEGTAFRKVSRIPPQKLKVNSVDGVAALVAAIGGSWGSTELEERYEYFEKALYGTIQRPDESHDSFLSRMEANFIELLARDTKLEEVQAYVLLRQSLLNSEDKKKILLEHGGNLRYDPVVKSFRLLGSRFFAELQGSKQQNRSKVYDVNLTENPEPDFSHGSLDVPEKAFHAFADDPEEIDGDYLEAMVASEDPDALVVQNFEQELEEFLQEVPGMHDAMTTYLEARQKLVQKKTSRGFWPIKGKSSGKGRGFNFKGKGRGKGRDGLLQRIANSYCRLCNQKGHWKNECPKKGQIPDHGAMPAAANLAEMTELGLDHDDVLVIDEMPDEVVSEDEEAHVHPEARPLICTEPNMFGLSCTSGQMLITLKGIAETLLSLLTLLLQVMMHQIEVSPALESEEESPQQSETQAMMTNMMQELQAQRNLLQEMMNQQSRASRSEVTSGRQTGRLSVEGVARRGLPLTRPPAETLSQQSWSVLEEEEILLEERLVEEAIHNFNHPRRAAPQNSSVATLPAASTPNATLVTPGTPVVPPGTSMVPSVPSPALNMEEWGRRVITWGRKHRGQTFQYVRTHDPGYAFQKRGLAAMRFTKRDGDLATAMMTNMMQELQAQRNLLQEMMNQQSRASRSEVTSGRQTGRLSVEGVARRGLPLTRPPAETLSQQSWSVLEEEEILLEERLVEEAIHNFNHPRRAAPQNSSVATLPAASTPNATLVTPGTPVVPPGTSMVPSVPSPALNMEEWGRRVITWGRKHRGLSAMRFTKRDGDLATVEGRRKLWDVISKYQPAYIWVAPECGPWSGWSRLNQFKSLRLFDKIESERQQQRAHIELCAKLCRFQKDRNRHFCLEQPLSSQMPHVEEFQDILKLTVKATFDMCAFGLKIPGTDRFLRKSSMVFTTDTDLAHELEKSRCRQDHIHQPIAGSVSVKHQRQALSQFCASYCRGFAVKIARIIGRRFQEAFHEDESPPKKLRFSHNLHKRARLDDSSRNSDPIDLDADELTAPGTSSAEPDPNQAPASVGRSPGSEASWNLILSMADRCAPRVGNIRYGADSEITQHMQRLVPGMHIQYVFVCRGTERFQLPSQATTDFPIRYTVCQHRHTGAVHDFGLENWVELKRSLRIRASVPSKICVTAFGTSLNVPVAESSVVPPMPLAVEQPDLPSIPEEPIIPETMNPVVPKNPDLCEGWAPPPTPLHGPKFRALSNQEKSDLALVHRNLGHPDPNVLSAHLKVQGADQRIVEAALEYVCDACVESVGKKHQRPAKLHDPLEFNQLVGVDGFFWSGKQGFQVHVFHCIDEASLFHLGRRLKTRNPDHTMNIWNEFWTSWAGNPQRLYSDPAGEFRSQEWKTALQARNICPEITTEAWQRGRVERHGDILKSMISRCDQESPIQTPEQFDQVLIMCCQAKNSLSRHQGYSPEQIVLGKAVSLPASICSDENLSAHSLALGNDQDSERFRRHLDQRSRARRAFLLTDNDQALRRALYRKSRPTRGPFLPNQLVMYWMKRNKSSRHECGRWHGPAKVILQESNSRVWISHMDRLFRCAPESLRPASLREWNSSTGSPMFGPQHIVSEPSEIPSPAGSIVDSNTYNWPDVEPSPTTPGDPPGETSEAPVSPQLSGQPESEVVPESLNPSDVLTPQVSSQEPAGPSISGVLDGASVPIDLESSDDQEDSLTSISQPILHCEALISQQEDLSSWDILHTDQTSSDLLLAHDELVLHAEPLTCCEEQCYYLEIDLNENDIHKWYNEVKPEAMIHVASVSKRARAEVQVKNLSLEERILFEKAKDAELNCWIQTNALRPVLRRSLNPEQILKSRWVLTWKNLEDSSAQPNHSSQHSRKAKARLVVLGFQDPKLTEVARDAPTLTREGRNTILQTIASMKWRLSSFDIKTAFLRGKADDSNPLAMEPPIELRKKLGLTDQQVCSLIGNAYGRVDAPLLFYKELVGQLKKLNFQVHPLEPCIFILESQGLKGRILHGVLGTHVDDGICGGDQYFHDQISKLKEVLPFGAFKQQRFVFTGIALEQLPDFSISANQEDYVHAIPAIDIGRLRRQRPDEPIQESELTKLRGLVGSLQYAVTHTRPDIAAKLGEIQSQMSRGTVATLIAANKVLREAQEFAHVKICFRHIPVSEVSHVSFGDASFASPKQLSSHQGTIICATNQKLNSNEQAPISPLIWTSKKISRVVRSTLSAEAFSMSRSVDQLGWMRLLWGVLVISNFDWRNPIVGLKQLPVSIIVTDCKSLYGLVTRIAMPSCEEYRTTLEVLLIRERCSEHSVFRWVPTSLQLADPLTKAMDAALLRAVLASGEFQSFDEEASLRCNSERKQAISWIKSKSQSHQ
eukprot:symbB.v1.2.025879.t1/scaffold2545.1/size76554/2